jgi:hypothetical protein
MRPFVLAIFLLFGIMVITMLSIFTDRPLARNTLTPDMQEKVHRLARGAANWGHVAEVNTTDPPAKFEHAINGLSYLTSARSFMSDADLSHVLGMDVNQLQSELEKQRAAAIHAIGNVCPALQPNTLLGIASGWLA